MMISYRKLSSVAFGMLLSCALPVVAVAQVTTRMGGVRIEKRIDENTALFDKETGQRISYQEYQQRMKSDPYAYYSEPVYDEHGKPTSYTIRPTTADEKATHRFYDRDPAKQPQVGQLIAPFVMTGLDGKTYRSADLLGNVVVLSFWISLEKPFWGDKQAVDFGDAIRPYQSETSPVVLGVLNSGQSQVTDHLVAKTLPFMPVPDAYGSHGKYHISTIPTFIVIDKTGKVAAFVEGQNYQKIGQVLSKVLR